MKHVNTLSSITRRGQLAAILCASLIAFASVASAQGHSHNAGTLSITAPTEVGGTMLPAGNYEVREAKSQDGPVVQFVRTVHNEQASELVQADEEEVVAEVKFTGHKLDAMPQETKLQLASNSHDATALEIRGVPVAYTFTTPSVDAQR